MSCTPPIAIDATRSFSWYSRKDIQFELLKKCLVPCCLPPFEFQFPKITEADCSSITSKAGGLIQVEIFLPSSNRESVSHEHQPGSHERQMRRARRLLHLSAPLGCHYPALGRESVSTSNSPACISARCGSKGASATIRSSMTLLIYFLCLEENAREILSACRAGGLEQKTCH